ncbi:MAG: PepSY domain-containing protein [Rhodobiaceae bacterium]|nr:PepSY domain-containing protein [Rhodobiaceae bacterium]MCC0054980.1 PepSY domain-containing protein [Rhodobiaceae bacterium]
MIATLILSNVLAAGIARADDRDRDCFVPVADWQPRDAVQKMATELGWTVRRIKIDDGCYQIKGTDRDGRSIEAKVNPATLEIVDMETKDRDHD